MNHTAAVEAATPDDHYVYSCDVILLVHFLLVFSDDAEVHHEKFPNGHAGTADDSAGLGQ